MKKKFLSNLLLVVVLNLLVKPFYIIGIDAEVQNRVGEQVYGNYFSLLNFSFLLNILLDFGLTNFNTRNIAQHPRLITKHFYKILSLRFLLFFLYAGATMTMGFLVDYSATEFYLLSILMLNQFLIAITQFCRSNFAGLHLFKTDALVSVMDKGLLILFCSVLLWTNIFGGELRIEWFVYAQTLAYGSTALISTIMLLNRTGKVKFNFQRIYSLAVLKQSFPYALLILLMMLYSRIDAVMLERMLVDGDHQAGIYAQGFRLLDAASMFSLLFAGLLLPIFSRLIKQKKPVTEMMELAFRLLFGASVIVAICCFFYQEKIIGLRYVSNLAVSSETFGILILSFIPISLGYVFGTLLTANGSLRYLNYMAVFGLILNIVLNVVFIREWQTKGAAFATLITQSLTVLVQIILAYRIFKFRINYKMLLSFAVFVFGIVIFHHIIHNVARMDELSSLLLLFGSSWVIAFVAGVFNLSDIKTIFTSAQSVGKDDQGDTEQ